MSEVFEIIPASPKPLGVVWGVAAISLLTVILLGLFCYILYSSQRTTFEISSEGLRIREHIYGRTVPGARLALEGAKQLDLKTANAYQPTLRTNGIGLSQFQAGWFRLRNGEKALLFVTDPTKVVYVPTRDGYSILLSTARPETFLQALARLSSSRSKE